MSLKQLKWMLADAASLAYEWHKPLSARLFPIAGGKPGDWTKVNDPHLFNTKLRVLP